MNEQFYVVLPSNSSLPTFHVNKTLYKIQPPHPLELDITKGEAALSEIQFPDIIYNIQQGYNTMIKQYISLSTDELNNIHKSTESEMQKEELEKIKILPCQEIIYIKN